MSSARVTVMGILLNFRSKMCVGTGLMQQTWIIYTSKNDSLITINQSKPVTQKMPPPFGRPSTPVLCNAEQ